MNDTDMDSLRAEVERLREALTLIERLYYIEDKDNEWRASRMNGVARSAHNGEDLGHYRRIFPRATHEVLMKRERKLCQTLYRNTLPLNITAEICKWRGCVVQTQTLIGRLPEPSQSKAYRLGS